MVALEDLQAADWRSLELVCARMFSMSGDEVELTSFGPDGGVDIICSRENFTFGVQCKRERQKISPTAVREFVGSLAAWDLKWGVFVTTGQFRREVYGEFGERDFLRLVDGGKLIEALRWFAPGDQEEITSDLFEDPLWDAPTCCNCGVKMVPAKIYERDEPYWECCNAHADPGCSVRMPGTAFEIHDRHREFFA